MRYIEKGDEIPHIILSFIEQQMAARETEDDWKVFSVDYDHFTGSRDLRVLLVKEQGGLCAYTGAGIDRRLPTKQPPSASYSYTEHIEHLKPQSQCKSELADRGLIPGKDVGEDMDYKNMVAAIGVRGTPSEWFGATVRENAPLPIWPTQVDCQLHFRYLDNGRIEGLDPEASRTVDLLQLNHRTLRGWRRSAINAFLPQDEVLENAMLQELVVAMDKQTSDELLEFCFVVKSVAERLLGE